MKDHYSHIYPQIYGLGVDGYLLMYSVEKRESFGVVMMKSEKVKYSDM